MKIFWQNALVRLLKCKQKVWNIFLIGCRPATVWSVTLLTDWLTDCSISRSVKCARAGLVVRNILRVNQEAIKAPAYLYTVWLAWFPPSSSIENLNTSLTVGCWTSTSCLLYVVIKTALSVKMINKLHKTSKKKFHYYAPKLHWLTL